MSDENLTHVFYATKAEYGHFYSTTADRAVGGSLIFLLVLGVLGNISASLYFWGRSAENFPDYLYAVNSMVDTLISALACPVITSLLQDRSAMLFRDSSFCSTYALLWTFLQRYSMFVVMVISVTRTVAISAPFHTIRETAVKIVMLNWAIVLAVLYIALFMADRIISLYFNKTVHCFLVTMTMEGWEWTVFMIFHLITALLVPLTVFISLIISCKSLMKKTVLGSEDDKLFWTISVTIALFTALFLICNVPLFAMYVTSSFKIWFNSEVETSSFLPESFVYWYDWLLASVFLPVLNASINPCLYFFRMPHFRRWISKKISSLFGLRSRVVTTSEHFSNAL